jgi:hypothetical protein
VTDTREFDARRATPVAVDEHGTRDPVASTDVVYEFPLVEGVAS